MNLGQLGVVVAIVGTLFGVYVAVRNQRKEARALAAAEAQAKQDIYNRGVVDGRASRDDEVRLLMSERDDARRERREAREERDRIQERYDNLRDRGER